MQIQTYRSSQSYRPISSPSMSTSQMNLYNINYYPQTNINNVHQSGNNTGLGVDYVQLSKNNNQFPMQNAQSYITNQKRQSQKILDGSNQWVNNDLMNKTMQFNNSYNKLKPDSSRSNNYQIQSIKEQSSQKTALKQHELKTKAANDYSYLPSPNNTLTQPTNSQLNHQFSNPIIKSPIQKTSIKQSSLDKQLQYTITKIQNQSLKRQNKKLQQTQQKLRKQLQQKVSKLTQFNQLMKIKYNQIKQLKSQLQLKQSIISQLKQQKSNLISLQQANKLKSLLIQKNKQLDQLNQQINNLQFSNFHNQVYQKKINSLYDQLQQQKNKNNNYIIQKSQLNLKITLLQQQLHILSFENIKSSTMSKLPQLQSIQNLFKQTQQLSPSKSKQSNHLTAFQQALKVQMKQIQQLKSVIDNNTQLVQKLKDNLISSRRQLQQLRNQMKILDLKANSQRKKITLQHRLQIHDKDNQINTAYKKYKTLQQKYKNALTEIKTKDDFFRQHLVGRVSQISIQQYIEEILKKYTQSFEDLISLKTENCNLKQKLQKYKQYEQLE